MYRVGASAIVEYSVGASARVTVNEIETAVVASERAGIELPSSPRKGVTVLWRSPTGTLKGVVSTGNKRACAVASSGCFAGRFAVKWADGHVTFPCFSQATQRKEGVWVFRERAR